MSGVIFDPVLRQLVRTVAHIDCQRALEPTSIRRLVMRMNPRICVHSETMLPTTWPLLLLGSMALNATTQEMPVTRRNRVSECSLRNSPAADRALSFGCLLSLDPFSYFHRDAGSSLLL